MTKRFEVIEDNGGGITLAVFGQEGQVEYLHTGYEYTNGQLQEDLEALKDGGDPVKDWDGNEDEPQVMYDQIISYEYGWEVVADNDGIYADEMGAEACRQFGIDD